MGKLSNTGPDSIQYESKRMRIIIMYFIQNNNIIFQTREKSYKILQQQKMVTQFRQKINKSAFIFLLSLFIILSSSKQEISLSIKQGYNSYHPLKNYFNSYQQLQISDLRTHGDIENYHFCYVDEVQQGKIQALQKIKIFNLGNSDQNKVIYDLTQILKQQKIIKSYYSKSKNILIVLQTETVKLYKIENGEYQSKIHITYSLSKKVTRGQFVETSNQILLLTDKKIYSISTINEQYKFTQVLSIPESSDSSYTSLKRINQNIFIFIDNTAHIYQNTENLKVPNKLAQIKFQNFQFSTSDFLYFNSDSKLLFLSEQQTGVWIIKDFSLTNSNNLIKKQNIFHIPNTKKCKQIYSWQQNYVIMKYHNKIMYFPINYLTNCINSNFLQCVNVLRLQQLKLGYNIEDFDIFDNQIYISHSNKLEVFTIVFENNLDDHTKKITFVKKGLTYHAQQSFNNLFLTENNRRIILITNNYFMNSFLIQEKNQLFCRTVDQNSRKSLTNKAGVYQGSLIATGICQLATTDQVQKGSTSNLCKIQIPLKIQIISQTRRYEAIFYVLISMSVLFVILIIVYYFIKKRRFQKLYSDQKGNQNLPQQTVFTQGSQPAYKFN